MGKLFGTDGIRGVVNAGLDASLAYKVGLAAAQVLTEEKKGERAPKRKFLENYCISLTQKAKDGKLDPASVVLESSGPRPAVKPAQQSARMRELSPHGAQGTARRAPVRRRRSRRRSTAAPNIPDSRGWPRRCIGGTFPQAGDS